MISAGHGIATYEYGISYFLKILKVITDIEENSLKQMAMAIRIAFHAEDSKFREYIDVR